MVIEYGNWVYGILSKISSLDFYEIPFKLSPDLCIRYLYTAVPTAACGKCLLDLLLDVGASGFQGFQLDYFRVLLHSPFLITFLIGCFLAISLMFCMLILLFENAFKMESKFWNRVTVSF